MVDESTRTTLSNIPLLKTRAGPRDKELWVQRLKEEYQAMIKYVQNNKDSGLDWFRLESNKEGTKWFGKCWYIHDLLKYEFDVEFDIPVTYPVTAPEIALPELDGKTAKMYRGGKICLTDHFKPLWGRNVPKFGLAHFIPVTYPVTAPEIALPELDGKTAKMYRGGKICLTDHFKPLWGRNVPKFGLAHLMALGLAPWLAVEIPDLIEKGVISYKEKSET